MCLISLERALEEELCHPDNVLRGCAADILSNSGATQLAKGHLTRREDRPGWHQQKYHSVSLSPAITYWDGEVQE